MQEAVETKPKKEQKKEKKTESAGLSHDELKELEDLDFGESSRSDLVVGVKNSRRFCLFQLCF